MFMRYLGIGIGHSGQHTSVEPNLHDPPDSQPGVNGNCDEGNDSDDAEGADSVEGSEDDEESDGEESDGEDSDFGYGDL